MLGGNLTMAVYDERIAANSDDARFYTGSSFFSNSTNTIFIGNASGDTNLGFWRFINLPMGPGSTIDSAFITFHSPEFGSGNPLNLRIYGFDEDNTATFSSSPMSRPLTTAFVDWTINPWVYNADHTTPDLKTIVQEIVDRAGWVATNAIGFYITNNGSSFSSEFEAREASAVRAARLVINYTGITTQTRTFQATAHILNPERDVGIKIMKPTYNALIDNDPAHQIFNSDYGTLKYALSGSMDIVLPGEDIAVSNWVEHNLGYKPFCEVYVQMDGSGPYYYVPGADAGATVFWQTGFRITNTRLQFYVDTSGFMSDHTFRFLYFIFKNDLQL